MRFVFVSYNYDPQLHSPEDWLAQIKPYLGILTALSNNNQVTRIKQINYEGDRLYQGVHFHFVNYGDAKLRFPWRLHRLVRSMNADVVVVHGLHYPLQTIQLRFHLPKKIKIIVQNHSEKPATGIRKLAQRMAGKSVNAYLFASKAMGLDWVKKGNLASSEKIHEVMEVSSVFYPVEKELAIAKTGVSGAPIFLWVARLNAIKDPLTVIKAFLSYTQINPGARLYMIYHTYELLAEITALLNTEPNAHSITLIGKVPNDELLYWYNSADFIISGSHHEGSGTAVCEAMSCGCVPVITDIFSFRAMTDNGSIGILYEAGNENELLTALIQTQQINVAKQREKALAYFKSNLSFEAIAQRIQEIAAAC
jgi:glycosyltransferase involved in cell wall biosynthesis